MGNATIDSNINRAIQQSYNTKFDNILAETADDSKVRTILNKIT
jgi:hypothetical protein